MEKLAPSLILRWFSKQLVYDMERSNPTTKSITLKGRGWRWMLLTYQDKETIASILEEYELILQPPLVV
jgi:hypothetical protein